MSAREEELKRKLAQIIDRYVSSSLGVSTVLKGRIFNEIITPLQQALAKTEAERDTEKDFHRRVDEAFAVIECISHPEQIPGLWQDWATERQAREVAESKLAAAEARIGELTEALRPFAESAETEMEDCDRYGWPLNAAISSTSIYTCNDLIRARAVLSSANSGEGKDAE